ncbi:MAG: hypothetical protein ACJ8AD_19565 [Gemmatimonadaceae bacterium]
MRQLASSLWVVEPDERWPKVRLALAAMCLEAHARGLPAETVVRALKAAWSQVPIPSRMSSEKWAREYYDVLGECMVLFFGPAA